MSERERLLLQAGWGGGWAAAWLLMAEEVEKAGGATGDAASFRRIAMKPPPMRPAEMQKGETAEHAFERAMQEKGGDA